VDYWSYRSTNNFVKRKSETAANGVRALPVRHSSGDKGTKENGGRSPWRRVQLREGARPRAPRTGLRHNLVRRWICSILGFGKIRQVPDEDPTSPNAMEGKCHPTERLCRTGSDPSRAPVWLHYQHEDDNEAPCEGALKPLRGCNSQQTQYSITPPPQPIENEDDDSLSAVAIAL
jgi:hypothetical protein